MKQIFERKMKAITGASKGMNERVTKRIQKE
jgi:hypothetical protein